MPVPVLSPELVELVGGIAAVLTTLSFLPQVLKAWRSRSARDVSLLMLLLFLAGVLLWLCYGLALGSLPLILAYQKRKAKRYQERYRRLMRGRRRKPPRIRSAPKSTRATPAPVAIVPIRPQP